MIVCFVQYLKTTYVTISGIKHSSTSPMRKDNFGLVNLYFLLN